MNATNTKPSKFWLKILCIAGIFMLAMNVSIVQANAASAKTKVPTQKEAYNAMIAMKSKYPEGKSWTNSNYYEWKGGIYSGGYGCAGFAFMLSDKAFGKLPARMMQAKKFTFSDIRSGDILRINQDTHSVIVLKVYENSVVIAEGNFNASIHWGRTLTKSEALAANYVITRYPVSFKFNKNTVKLKEGGSEKLSVSANPSSLTKALKWKSSDPKIVKVSKNGKATALKAGTAVITATASTGKSASCKVTVK